MDNETKQKIIDWVEKARISDDGYDRFISTPTILLIVETFMEAHEKEIREEIREKIIRLVRVGFSDKEIDEILAQGKV